MKYLSAWPRWARILCVALVVAASIAGGVALQYRSLAPKAAGKTTLAHQFEAAPGAWLQHPKDVSEFERLLAARAVAAVGVDGQRLLVTTRAGQRFSAELVSTQEGVLTRLEALSREQGFALTRVKVDPRTESEKWLSSTGSVLERLASLLLIAATVALGYYLVRQSGGMGGSAKAKLTEKPGTSFADVIGASEAKAALQQVTAFMRNPQKYLALGARPPRGVLLEGPPGTGKTLLARALAGECKANFIAVDGSHFSSMFYGQGISKVRELFATARKHAPCIVFIDEFDGIGKRASGSKVQGGQSEENRIINKLLVEMDGFLASENVVVIGATNHVANVDDALKRPGRFDLVARVHLPTVHDRTALFRLCLSRVKAASGIDTEALGRASSALSHADITNVVNRATVGAAEAGADFVMQEHLHRALESHQLGGEVSALKSMITPEHRERIAVHEGGHALVAHVLKAGTVERISIEPRGQALGVTFVTRQNEVPLYGEAELKARLAMLLAGREAELMTYGNTTSGASDDLKRASELAIEMVSSMGFSNEFGLLSLQGVPEGLVGPHIQERVLAEAKVMLDAAQRACRETLEHHRNVLQMLKLALLKDETVSGALLRDAVPLHDDAEAANEAVLRRVAMEANPAQGVSEVLS
jgi:cell division protease FtsH